MYLASGFVPIFSEPHNEYLSCTKLQHLLPDMISGTTSDPGTVGGFVAFSATNESGLFALLDGRMKMHDNEACQVFPRNEQGMKQLTHFKTQTAKM